MSICHVKEKEVKKAVKKVKAAVKANKEENQNGTDHWIKAETCL